MATEILIRPIVTEKFTALGEKLNRYAFVVDKNANKIEIKGAVQELYGVTVAAVNTVRYAGKVKSRFTKSELSLGKRTHVKGNYYLEEGEKIDFYSNI